MISPKAKSSVVMRVLLGSLQEVAESLLICGRHGRKCEFELRLLLLRALSELDNGSASQEYI